MAFCDFESLVSAAPARKSAKENEGKYSRRPATAVKALLKACLPYSDNRDSLLRLCEARIHPDCSDHLRDDIDSLLISDTATRSARFTNERRAGRNGILCKRQRFPDVVSECYAARFSVDVVDDTALNYTVHVENRFRPIIAPAYRTDIGPDGKEVQVLLPVPYSYSLGYYPAERMDSPDVPALARVDKAIVGTHSAYTRPYADYTIGIPAYRPQPQGKIAVPLAAPLPPPPDRPCKGFRVDNRTMPLVVETAVNSALADYATSAIGYQTARGRIGTANAPALLVLKQIQLLKSK